MNDIFTKQRQLYDCLYLKLYNVILESSKKNFVFRYIRVSYFNRVLLTITNMVELLTETHSFYTSVKKVYHLLDILVYTM